MARSREDVIREDVADLHKLGYAQELFRSMGGFSNFAISFSIISILTGAVILYDYGLAWAGTAAVLIGWPLITVFVLLIAASMGEIASAYPTAGGLYYWASRMKNKNWGWWTAWLNLIGQFAIVAACGWALWNFRGSFGVADFEGRSFLGWQHHMTLSSAAFAGSRLVCAHQRGVRPENSVTVAAEPLPGAFAGARARV